MHRKECVCPGGVWEKKGLQEAFRELSTGVGACRTKWPFLKSTPSHKDIRIEGLLKPSSPPDDSVWS